jgi:hypothetical protein
MNDDLEQRLQDWLDRRGSVDAAALDGLVRFVALLPPRRRRVTPVLGALAAAIVAAVALSAVAILPHVGSTVPSTSPSPSRAAPPDPYAFVGDPRLLRCLATPASAIDIFEMRHARDYRLHLPASGLSPELDVEEPALVVVYAGVQPFGTTGGAPPAPGSTPRPARTSPDPGTHDICVLVGADPATAELNVYENVDISGLTVDVMSVDRTPAPSPSLPSPSTTSPPTTTPEPGTS